MELRHWRSINIMICIFLSRYTILSLSTHFSIHRQLIFRNRQVYWILCVCVVFTFDLVKKKIFLLEKLSHSHWLDKNVLFFIWKTNTNFYLHSDGDKSSLGQTGKKTMTTLFPEKIIPLSNLSMTELWDIY